MSTSGESGAARFQLPQRRRALQALVLGILLPAVLLGAATTSGGCCGCSGDTGSFGSRGAQQTGAEDPFPVGFVGGNATISFPNPDGTEIVGNKSRALVTNMTAGMAVLYPAGTVTVGGTATTAGARGANLPRKINVDVEHTPAGGSPNKVFSTVAKIKAGKISQTNDRLDGFTALTDEPVKTFVKPKGGALANDQTFALNFNFTPDAAALVDAARTYGWAGLDALDVGLRAVRALPPSAAIVPLLLRADRSIEAKTKADLVRFKFGVGFDTPAVNLQIGGGFFGAGTREGKFAPTSMKVFIQVRDGAGKKKLSVNYKLTVKDNNITAVTKLIDALNIAPNDVLDIDVKLKGGTVNPGDGMFLILSATPAG